MFSGIEVLFFSLATVVGKLNLSLCLKCPARA